MRGRREKKKYTREEARVYYLEKKRQKKRKNRVPRKGTQILRLDRGEAITIYKGEGTSTDEKSKT